MSDGDGAVALASAPVSWQEPEQVEDTQLVITELVQNVVQHTGDGGVLALSLRVDGVLVEVTDRSVDMPEMLDPDARRIGGRGLLVVAAVSRSWGGATGSGGQGGVGRDAAPGLTGNTPAGVTRSGDPGARVRIGRLPSHVIVSRVAV